MSHLLHALLPLGHLPREVQAALYAALPEYMAAMRQNYHGDALNHVLPPGYSLSGHLYGGKGWTLEGPVSVGGTGMRGEWTHILSNHAHHCAHTMSNWVVGRLGEEKDLMAFEHLAPLLSRLPEGHANLSLHAVDVESWEVGRSENRVQLFANTKRVQVPVIDTTPTHLLAAAPDYPSVVPPRAWLHTYLPDVLRAALSLGYTHKEMEHTHRFYDEQDRLLFAVSRYPVKPGAALRRAPGSGARYEVRVGDTCVEHVKASPDEMNRLWAKVRDIRAPALPALSPAEIHLTLAATHPLPPAPAINAIGRTWALECERVSAWALRHGWNAVQQGDFLFFFSSERELQAAHRITPPERLTNLRWWKPPVAIASLAGGSALYDGTRLLLTMRQS